MAQLNPIPDKKFFRQHEVCQVTDTQPYVLRFWESEFPQLSPDGRRGGQRVYRREDVALVLRIKQLLHDEEYTLDGARARIEEELGGDGLALDAGVAEASSDADGPNPAPPAPGRSSSAVADVAEGMARRLDFEPSGPTTADDAAVSRQRYEDALDEITHLRLLLQEAETKARKAETRREDAERRAAHHEGRAARLVARFESVLEILERD